MVDRSKGALVEQILCGKFNIMSGAQCACVCERIVCKRCVYAILNSLPRERPGQCSANKVTAHTNTHTNSALCEAKGAFGIFHRVAP